MMHHEPQLREDICRIGRLMYEKGWIASNDGNISIRLPDNRLLVTPTGVSKGMLAPEDLLLCDLEGRKISGTRDVTSEIGMHLTIYRERPDAYAVVHAHPPVATGFAVAGRSLNLGILPEVIVTLGVVPLAAYGLPGTPELSEAMLPYLPKYDAMLLANHGAVAFGPDVLRAFFRLETVEHFARILLVSELLGGAQPLPRVEIARLFEARGRYGVAARNRFEPEGPLAAEDFPEIRRGGEARIELTRDQLREIIEQALRAQSERALA